MLLYELLTLETPFAGESYIEVLDKLRSEQSAEFSAADSDIPADLRTICCKCLEKQPRDRYASASELRDDLNRYLCGAPIQAQPSNWVDKFSRWCRRPARLIAAGKFSFWLQAGVLAWVAVVGALASLTGAIPASEVSKSLLDILFVAATMHLPLGLLGLILKREKWWAFWPSTIGNCVMLVIFVHATVSPAVAFDYHYPNQLTKLQTFVPLTTLSVIATVLHLLAIPAWFSKRDNRRNAVKQ